MGLMSGTFLSDFCTSCLHGRFSGTSRQVSSVGTIITRVRRDRSLIDFLRSITLVAGVRSRARNSVTGIGNVHLDAVRRTGNLR